MLGKHVICFSTAGVGRQVVEYHGITRGEGEPLGEGLPHLCDALELHFSGDLDLPRIQDEDLVLLDKAISLLNPPMAQLRVVEATTFTVSERGVIRGASETART